MTNISNFSISADRQASEQCRQLELYDFHQLCTYIKNLPYQRNSVKSPTTIVLDETCGTCSTKHALLKTVAEENNQASIQLMLGIFKMGSAHSKALSSVLKPRGLSYIPEAHNYLMESGQRFDYTGLELSGPSPFDTLLSEQEIQADEIGAPKVELHKGFLKKWLMEEQLDLSLSEIWAIREACILALSNG